MFVSTRDLLRISPVLGSISRGYVERPAGTLYDAVCTLEDIAVCEEAISRTTNPGHLAYLRSELDEMREELASII